MATFEALQQRVSARLKDPNNVDISASDVAAVINDAIQHWAKRRYWFNEFSENVTLTEGDPVLPALVNNPSPTQIFKTDGIVIDYASSRWIVNKISSEEYDAMNTQGSGIPYAYTYRNNQYELYYYPAEAYSLTVRGLKTYALLVNNTDTNDFTDNADMLIIYETLARLSAEFRQDVEMEGYYSARAANEHTSLRRETIKNNASGRLNVEGF